MVHPERNVVTRALGVEPEVEVDTEKTSAKPGDIFLLCSDGLLAHVHDDEIREIATGSEDLQVACDALVDQANARGGVDNTSVVLVHFEKTSQ